MPMASASFTKLETSDVHDPLSGLKNGDRSLSGALRASTPETET